MSLVRGHRKLVMFLRRFGDGDSTRVLSAAASRLRESWRMVTLDDAEIEPIGLNGALVGVVGGFHRAATLFRTLWKFVGRLWRKSLTAGCCLAVVIVVVTHRRGEPLAGLIDANGTNSLRTPFQIIVVSLAVVVVGVPAVLLVSARPIRPHIGPSSPERRAHAACVDLDLLRRERVRLRRPTEDR